MHVDPSGLSFDEFARRCDALDRATEAHSQTPIWRDALRSELEVIGPAWQRPSTQRQEEQYLFAVVRQIRAQGVTLVWIEHIVHALRAVVDRLVAIDFGRRLMDGPPDAVMASPEVQRVYLGIEP